MSFSPRLCVFSCLLLLLTLPALLCRGDVAVRSGRRVPSGVPASFVAELTDASFEHDTQAATGSTTGDWFVVFVAPWCSHCTTFQPAFDELSVWAREEQLPVTLAKVDATAHTTTAARFDVRAFPTIKFLSQGRVYDYAKGRTLQAMQQFLAERQWIDMPSRAVPAETSGLDSARAFVSQQLSELQSLVSRKTGASGLLLGVGVLVGILAAIVGWIVCCEKGPVVHRVSVPPTRGAANVGQSSAAAAAHRRPKDAAAKKKE